MFLAPFCFVFSFACIVFSVSCLFLLVSGRPGRCPTADGVRVESAFDALQEAKNSLVSVSGVSPMQLVFGRNPEIPGNLLGENPDLVASSSFLHDRDARQAARVRTIAKTK